ncbi:MAG TPA: M24 family metallopeptidase [Pyrinomonadaceae bacterium]|nr:M24 family metallopeptidase [Pyrinomonadaceae bacterium]
MRKKPIKFALALCALIFAFSVNCRAQGEPSRERVKEIQAAILEAGFDGWLFYDFRGSDPLAYRILKLDQRGITTRRWFYYIPATGEPVKLVHSIERDKLDQLPGKKLVYLPWQQLHAFLRDTLTAGGRPGALVHTQRGNLRVYARRDAAGKARRIAMQYSPNNDVPYMSRVDAGTIELIRSFGVEPMPSADLVQRFEAVWTPAQLETHIEASDKIHRIIMQAFDEIARRIRAGESVTEYDIQQFMVRRYEEENLMSDGEPPIIAVNANAANPHYEPTRTVHAPIKRGDFVLFDVWAKLKKENAVYTDQTWTGYVGETVPEEYTRIFNIVREARDSAVRFVQESMRSGRPIKGADVDDVSRGVITRAGYGAQFLHRTGHSIGEEVHGNGANIDDLETRDARRIIPRTTFSIEPGIYLEGKFGVRSEIDVHVTDRDAIVTGQPIQTAVIAILSDR